jgi:hypothetical protein
LISSPGEYLTRETNNEVCNVKFPPVSFHIVLLRPTYFYQHTILRHSRLSSSLSLRDQVCHLYNIATKTK